MAIDPIMPSPTSTNRVRALAAYHMLPDATTAARRHDLATHRMRVEIQDVVDLRAARDRAVEVRALRLAERKAAAELALMDREAPPVAAAHLAAAMTHTVSPAIAEDSQHRPDVVPPPNPVTTSLSTRTDGLPPVPVAFGDPRNTTTVAPDNPGRPFFRRVALIVVGLIVIEWLLLTWLTRGG